MTSATHVNSNHQWLCRRVISNAHAASSCLNLMMDIPSAEMSLELSEIEGKSAATLKNPECRVREKHDKQKQLTEGSVTSSMPSLSSFHSSEICALPHDSSILLASEPTRSATVRPSSRDKTGAFPSKPILKLLSRDLKGFSESIQKDDAPSHPKSALRLLLKRPLIGEHWHGMGEVKDKAPTAPRRPTRT